MSRRLASAIGTSLVLHVGAVAAYALIPGLFERKTVQPAKPGEPESKRDPVSLTVVGPDRTAPAPGPEKPTPPKTSEPTIAEPQKPETKPPEVIPPETKRAETKVAAPERPAEPERQPPEPKPPSEQPQAIALNEPPRPTPIEREIPPRLELTFIDLSTLRSWSPLPPPLPQKPFELKKPGRIEMLKPIARPEPPPVPEPSRPPPEPIEAARPLDAMASRQLVAASASFVPTTAPAPPLLAKAPPPPRDLPLPLDEAPAGPIVLLHPEHATADEATREDLAQGTTHQSAAGAPTEGGADALEVIREKIRSVTWLFYGGESRRHGHHGTALVRFRMNSMGYATAMQLLKSTGHPALDAEVERILHEAEVYPYVPGWVAVPVSF